MRLRDLPQTALGKIARYRYDRIVEKHEGPERWKSVLEFYAPEFLVINGYHVLLPIQQEHHPHVTVLRCIVSRDEQSLTLFLKDTTFADTYGPGDELFWAGYLAVCDKVPGEEFYIAVVYHEWFIIENSLSEQNSKAILSS